MVPIRTRRSETTSPSCARPRRRWTAPSLDLSYTAVRAPIDGIVTRVEQIQIGDHVDAATPLFALMSSTDIWVEANFKETDLTYMRPGQARDLHAWTLLSRQDAHRPR